MPRAFGRAYVINKRTSHINLVLDTKEEKNQKSKGTPDNGNKLGHATQNLKSKVKSLNNETKIEKKPAKKTVTKKIISKKPKLAPKA